MYAKPLVFLFLLVLFAQAAQAKNHHHHRHDSTNVADVCNGYEQTLVDLYDGASALTASEIGRISIRGRIIENVSDLLLTKCQSGTGLSNVEIEDIGWMERALNQDLPNAHRLKAPLNDGYNVKLPIEIKNGHLTQEGKQIHFFGSFRFELDSDNPIESDGWRKELGMNIVGGAFGPRWSIPRNDWKYRSSTTAHLIEEDYGVRDVVYSSHLLPKWIFGVCANLPNGKASQGSSKMCLPNDMRYQGYGFLPINISSELTKRANSITISNVLKDYKRHHFSSLLIDIANEPHYTGAAPAVTVVGWQKFLTGTAKTKDELDAKLLELNARWKTHFGSISEITIPCYIVTGAVTHDDRWTPPLTRKTAGTGGCNIGKITLPTDPSLLPQFYDWVQFNNARLTEYFVGLKAEMKAVYPEALYHLKVDTIYPTNPEGIALGIDPVMLANHLDLLNPDTWTFFGGVDKDFAVVWQPGLFAQTMWKSLAPEKPLINSESHYQAMCNPLDANCSGTPQNYGPSQFDSQPWNYLRTAKFLQVINGLEYDFMWQWDGQKEQSKAEQWKSASSDLDRAQQTDSVVQAHFEFSQYKNEIRAFQDQRPEIAIVLSQASLTREAGRVVNEALKLKILGNIADPGQPNCTRLPGESTHLSVLCNISYALMQMGTSPAILMEGANQQDALKYKAIIVPNAQYLSADMAEKLQKAASHGVKILVVGAPPTFDPYGRLVRGYAFLAHLENLEDLSQVDSERHAHAFFQGWLAKQQLLSPVVVRDSSGQIPYGIYFRVVPQGTENLVFVANLTPEKKSFRVGSEELIDVLSGKPIGNVIHLGSLGLHFLKTGTKVGVSGQ